MSQEKIDILKRSLIREKAARKAAELILEDKSRELYFISEELKQANFKLGHLLEEKSSQLEGVFENIVDAYVVIDLSGNVMKLNDAATLFFGYDIEIESLNVLDLIHKEDMDYALSSFSDLQTYGFFKNYQARVYTKSKEVKWVHINASVIFDNNNNPIAAQGIVRDITEQKASDEKLIDSESRLAALVLNLNSGVILEDENRKIVLSNNKFCELFSIEAKPESIIGIDCELGYEQNKNLFKDPSAFIERINQIVGGKVAVIGDVLEMADGKILERNYLPVFVGEKIKGFLWTFTDITLEKNYNLSLEALKTKYSRIIANMNLGLLEVDKEDNILMMNQSFSDMSGYSEAEILGKNANSIFVSKEDQKLITSQSNNRFVGNYNSYEIKVKNKKGEFKHWFVSGAPNYDLLGEFIGSIGIHLDITAIKELELQKECIFLV